LDSEREVSKEDGQKMAEKFGCKFIETSAKTNLNVAEAFISLVKDVAKVKKASVRDSSGDNKKCILQ
jgi:GTPase KRas